MSMALNPVRREGVSLGLGDCGEDLSFLIGCDSTIFFHFRTNPSPHLVHAFADWFCDRSWYDVHHRDDSYIQIFTETHV